MRRRHRHSQPGAVVATQGSGAAGAGPGRGRQRGGAAARRAGRGQPAGAGNRRGAGRGAGDHHQRRAALRHLRAQPARRLCPGRPGAGQALRCRFARWPAGARRGCRRLARRGPFAARPGGSAGDSRDALGACAAGRGTADPSALRAGGARTCRRGGGRGAPGAGRCRPGRGGARRLAGRQRADGRSAPAGRRRCARRTAALPAADRSRCAPAPGLARRRAGRRPAGGGRRAPGDGPHRPASRPTHGDRPGARLRRADGACGAAGAGRGRGHPRLPDLRRHGRTLPRRTGAAWQRQPRGIAARPACLRTGGDRQGGGVGIVRRPRRVRHGRRGAGSPAWRWRAGLGRGRAADLPWRLGGPGHRGQGGGASGPRFLPAVAVRQPQALGGDRAAPGPGRRRRPGDGFLQSDLAGAALATGTGAGDRRPPSFAADPGGARSRHRAAR
ncbi:Uncharacterised protein [Enterobacter cloacae]|nr:Uncharacterised protein [Enterobacter cloacae]